MKFNKKTVLAGFAIIFIFGAIAGGLYLKSVFDYQSKVKATTVSDVDLSSLPDGVYTGEYDVGFIGAKVEVTVQNGAITEIKLIEHKNDRGSAAESVVQAIETEQKINVDSVAGATNSSVVIKKAIENALKKT